MFGFLVFFIPSIIGTRIINYFNKDIKIKDILYDYITLFFFSFVINIFIMYNFFEVKKDIFSAFNNDMKLFVWMGLISIIINVILVFIGLVVQKNMVFKIKIESSKNEEKANIKKGSKNTTKNKKSISKTTKKNKNK